MYVGAFFRKTLYTTFFIPLIRISCRNSKKDELHESTWNLYKLIIKKSLKVALKLNFDYKINFKINLKI